VTAPARSAEFLGLFNEIEQHLRTVLDRAQHESFSTLAAAYVEQTRLPRTVLRDLRTFAELRNLLSHQPYYADQPIAEPAAGVVEHIRQVRDLLLRPPTVLAALGPRQVTSVHAEDSIRSVLELVRTLSYSQFPVHDGEGWAGLLTTNAIARWFARQLHQDEVSTGEETVAVVLGCSEEQDTALHVPRTTTVGEAVELLGRPLGGGARPAALVVTENGRPAEKPLAVVVDQDLSTLHRALDVATPPARRASRTRR